MGMLSEEMSSKIYEKDARAMVRLLGQVAALEGGHADKKRFLMEGLCELIQADAWVWALGCQLKPGEEQIYSSFMHEGLGEVGFSKLLKTLNHPVMGKVVEPFYLKLATDLEHATMTRDEMDPDQLSYQPDVNDLWEDANIGPVMMSGFPLDADSLSCIAVYRKVGKAHFSEREKKIAHIMLEEVEWLHLSGWPEDRGVTVPRLYPQQRTVLNLLLDGLSRKCIAEQMNISENTVSGYVKDVYRHFEVNSQAALMKKFLSGSHDE